MTRAVEEEMVCDNRGNIKGWTSSKKETQIFASKALGETGIPAGEFFSCFLLLAFQGHATGPTRPLHLTADPSSIVPYNATYRKQGRKVPNEPEKFQF